MGAAEPLEELLSLDRMRQMTGMGTTFIYGEIQVGRFPRSIRIGRRPLWMQSEVQGWIRQQIVQNRPLQVDGQAGGQQVPEKRQSPYLKGLFEDAGGESV